MGYSMPYFPMYAAETLADGRFQSWSCEERGAWLTLICLCWNDGDIPESQTVLGRLLHLDAVAMASAWHAIGDRFSTVPGKPGRLMSPRLEEEREKAIDLARKRSLAGVTGANARWDEENKRHGKRMRLPKQAQGNGIANECPPPSSSSPPSSSPLHACKQAEGSKLGPLGSQLVREVEAGLGHGLIPAKNGQAEKLESLVPAFGGVAEAKEFVAAICRRGGEPKSVGWLVKVLSESVPSATQGGA